MDHGVAFRPGYVLDDVVPEETYARYSVRFPTVVNGNTNMDVEIEVPQVRVSHGGWGDRGLGW
jgi:hypothetical protein